MFKGFVNNDLASHAFNRLTVKFVGSRENSNETYLGLTDEDFRADPDRRYTSSQLDNMNWWRTAIELTHNLAVGDNVRSSRPLRTGTTSTAPGSAANQFRDGTQFLERADLGPNTPPLDSLLPGPHGRAGLPLGEKAATDARTSWSSAIASGSSSWAFRPEAPGGFRHREAPSRDRVGSSLSLRLRRSLSARAGLPDAEHAAGMGRTHLQRKPRPPDRRQQRRGPGARGLSHVRARVSPASSSSRVCGSNTSEPSSKTARTRRSSAAYARIRSSSFSLASVCSTRSSRVFAALAGVHRGFSAVTPGNRGTADPELSINYEAGFRYVTKDSLGFAEAIGFFNDYSNITSECTQSAGCNPELRSTSSSTTGARLSAESKCSAATPCSRCHVTSSMPFRVAYTFTSATYRTSFESSDPTIGDVEKRRPDPVHPRARVERAALGSRRTFWGAYLDRKLLWENHRGCGRTPAAPDDRPVLHARPRRPSAVRAGRGVSYDCMNVTNTRADRLPAALRCPPKRTPFVPGGRPGDVLRTETGRNPPRIVTGPQNGEGTC